MILEGIVTTINLDETTNVSPMGPTVQPDMSRFLLRPFPDSTTYANLKRNGVGVLHVTDDAELIARAAVGNFPSEPPTWRAETIEGRILSDACRWYAFRVVSIDDRHPRSEISCETVDRGRQRDFFGFNRAKHAVVEAAILATRIPWISADEILDQYQRLETIVSKTAGPAELRAFQFLRDYLDEQLANVRSTQGDD